MAHATTEMYLLNMEPAMTPSGIWAGMTHRETERIVIDDLEGCAAGILLTSYPPGIPPLIPGERFNKTIVQYLQFVCKFNELFPDLETDTHGLVEGEVDGRMEYFVGCVR